MCDIKPTTISYLAVIDIVVLKAFNFTTAQVVCITAMNNLTLMKASNLQRFHQGYLLRETLCLLFPPKHHLWFPGLLITTGNANILSIRILLPRVEGKRNTKI